MKRYAKPYKVNFYKSSEIQLNEKEIKRFIIRESLVQAQVGPPRKSGTYD
jgi:hypothetical protein